MEPNIAPLAKRLAEENNVNWRGLSGSGSDGRIIERDVLEYLAKVMAGEESVNPTAEPVPEGMEAWPEEDVKGFFESQASEGSVSDSDTAWPSLTETDTLDKLEKEQQELKKTAENLEAIDAEAEAEDLLKQSGVFDFEDDSLELEDESSIFENEIFVTESDVEFDESILNEAGLSDDIFEEVSVEESPEDIFLLDEDTEITELDAILEDTSETDVDEISSLFAEADEEVKSEDMLIDQQLGSENQDSSDITEEVFVSEQEEIDEDLASLFVDPDADELTELSADTEVVSQIEEINADLEDDQVFAEAEVEELEEISEIEDSVEIEAAAEQDIETEDSDDVYNVLDGDEEMLLEAETEELVELESLEESLDIGLDSVDIEAEIDEQGDIELSTEELEDLLEDVGEEAELNQDMKESLEDSESAMGMAAVVGTAGAAVAASLASETPEEPDETDTEEALFESEIVEDTEEVIEEIEIEASEELTEEAIEEPEVVEIEAETVEAEAEEVIEIEEEIELDASEEVEAVEVSEQFEEPEEVPLVAASSQLVSTMPSMSYGVLLRRHLDMEKLIEAQEVVSAELGSNVDFSAFLLRAAAKAARQTGLVDSSKLGLVNFAGKGININAIDNHSDSFGKFVKGIGKAKSYDIGSDKIELVVADMSALEVDEVVLNAVAPVLSLGRINHISDGDVKSTLSISGDVSIETGAKFLAVVAELLASPIRLLV